MGFIKVDIVNIQSVGKGGGCVDEDWFKIICGELEMYNIEILMGASAGGILNYVWSRVID